MGLQLISSFSFFAQNRFSIFPSPGIGLHTFLKQRAEREEGRTSREVVAREDEGAVVV